MSILGPAGCEQMTSVDAVLPIQDVCFTQFDVEKLMRSPQEDDLQKTGGIFGFTFYVNVV
jgi:hypothetical protein